MVGVAVMAAEGKEAAGGKAEAEAVVAVMHAAGSEALAPVAPLAVLSYSRGMACFAFPAPLHVCRNIRPWACSQGELVGLIQPHHVGGQSCWPMCSHGAEATHVCRQHQRTCPARLAGVSE